MRRRTILLGCLSATLLSAVTYYLFNALQQVALTSQSTSRPIFSDLATYWSSFHLAVSGENPYEHSALNRFQSVVGLPHSTPIYCFPTLFLLFYPVLILPFPTAAAVLAILNIALVLIVTLVSWWLFAGSRIRPSILGAASATFLPAVTVVKWGQCSLVVAAAFFLGLRYYSRGNKLAAGAVISLALIKPHLFWLALIALVIDSIRSLDKRFLVGLGGGVLLQLIAVSLLFPSLIEQRLLTQSAPLEWLGISLVGLVRLAVYWITAADYAAVALLLPTVAGLYCTYWALKRERSINLLTHVPTLIGVSCLTTPYIWIPDLAILQPLYLMLWLRAANKNLLSIAMIATLILGATYFIAIDRLDFPIVWYPILLFIAYLATQPKPKPAVTASAVP